MDGDTHRCFIQRAPTPQELRRAEKARRKRQRQGGPRAKRGAAAGLHTLQANAHGGGGVDDVDDDDALPPLHVFFDIEAMQPHEQHIANLVVAETEDNDRPVRFPGEHCLRDFLEWLDTLTLNDTRQVNVLAHNFQGYDGYFVVHQYHSDNRIVRTTPERVQTLGSPTRSDSFHRFSQFLPDAFVGLSQNLWIDGTPQGLLPSQV